MPYGKLASSSFGVRLRVLQIIARAMTVGIVTLLAVLLGVKHLQLAPQPSPTGPIITYVAVAQFVVCFLVWMALPVRMVSAHLARLAGQPSAQTITDEAALLFVWRTPQIINLALLEGPALIGEIAYFQDGNVLALGVTGFCLFLMLATFPTRDRMTQRIAAMLDQLLDLQRNRDLGDSVRSGVDR